MNHPIACVIAISTFLAVQGGIAQDRSNDPGASTIAARDFRASLWTSTANSYDFGLGWWMDDNWISDYMGTYDGASRLHFHVDHLWESFGANEPAVRVAFDKDTGGLNSGESDYYVFASMREVLDVDWLVPRSQIERFLDLEPSFQIITPSGIPLDPGIGFRFYFWRYASSR
jgi:hypothetical protein